MDYVRDYEATHVRIDSLFFGVFLSFLGHVHPGVVNWIANHRGAVGVVGLLMVLPMFLLELGSPFVKTFGYTFLALGYGCLLMVFVTTQPGVGRGGWLVASRGARCLAWVGVWSYSIYLWHGDLHFLFTFLAAHGAALVAWTDLWQVTYLGASVGLGALLGHLVEKPVLAWRDRIYPSRTRSPFATDWQTAAASEPVEVLEKPESLTTASPDCPVETGGLSGVT
jgi:peptidoglycan/LPS O-acetylase OafA/YrhL